MRLAPDWNTMRQLSRRSIEHVHLVVVAPRHPELPSIGGDATHVRTPAAGNGPGRNDLVRHWIENADRARPMTAARYRIPAAVGHVQVLAVSARINPVRAYSR